MPDEEEEAIEEMKSCAACIKAGNILCTDCYRAPDCDGFRMYSTYYCSGEFQEGDWKKLHKDVSEAAKNRRAVYRLGEIAQVVFQAYMKRLYHRGDNDANLIFAFPETLFEDEDKIAALTALTCGNALEFVHMLFGKRSAEYTYCLRHDFSTLT